MAKQKTPSTPEGPNMTPMIDCVFQLIIFFVITAKFVQDEKAKLIVPDPFETIAQIPAEDVAEAKVIVSIPNKFGDEKNERDPVKAGLATTYQVGNKPIKPYDGVGLINELNARQRALGVSKDDLIVEIRADKDLYYSQVEPLISTAGEAELTKMKLTTFTDPDKQKKPE